MDRIGLKNNFEYFIFRVLSGWLRAKPIPEAIEFHNKLGAFWFKRLKIRRDVTVKNLQRAFPGKTDAEIQRLAQKVFFHFSRVSIEQIILPKIIRHDINQFIDSANWEVLEEAMNEDRGVILLTGHIGNWEILGSAVALKGFPAWAVAAEMRNSKVDRSINEHRNLSGLKIISREHAKSTFPKIFGRGEMVCLLADQDAGRNGVFVPFFGRLASTPPGPAVYHFRNRVPIVYTTALLKNGRYRIYFERLHFAVEKGNLRSAVRKVTEIHVRRLEQDIRLHPEQWFWLHRRWKTAPETEPNQ
ncbi:MAG TPA: hypothetical protein ENH29_09700 [Bacteroidetes bacterium]|nr:hypothetical protein [Bacteroidota bacterium]